MDLRVIIAISRGLRSAMKLPQTRLDAGVVVFRQSGPSCHPGRLLQVSQQHWRF